METQPETAPKPRIQRSLDLPAATLDRIAVYRAMHGFEDASLSFVLRRLIERGLEAEGVQR